MEKIMSKQKPQPWSSLTSAEKTAHRAHCAKLRAQFDDLDSAVDAASKWVGKNGPASSPFGRETVETRAWGAEKSERDSLWDQYQTAITQFA
jgi:hypothetical protein